MPRQYSPQQFFLSIVAAVLVAGLVGYFVGRQAGDSTVPNNSNDTANIGGSLDGTNNNLTATSSSLSAEGNAVEIKDQIAGNAVVVQSVTFKEAGWIAIYEDRDGKPGNILGARWYPAGETKNGPVELLRPTVKGVYYARFHKDDGNHLFDLKIDSPLVDGSGNPVTMRFVVSEVASTTSL
jgi:hypothetical protein